eukprot:10775159-Ditylum_brightwellii.AAC.1
MEPLRSRAPPMSKSASISAVSTPHRNSSIGEENAVEKACANQYGIGLPRDKNRSETVHVSGPETAAHLGKSHPQK